MKKLMIAAAIVCAAAVSQAATYYWNYINNEGGELYTLTGTKFSGDAYLFAVADVESVYNAWNADNNVDFTTLADYSQTVTFANGLVNKSFSTESDSADGNYFTLVMRDAAKNLFIAESTTATGSIQPGGADLAVGVEWTSMSEYRDMMKFDPATDGYQGMGYYTSVPEPTSGLLLLLGVAGMALRRRRA